jgi:serine/threonine protein kinase
MVDVGGAPIDRYVVMEHLSEGGMGAIYVGKKLGAGGFEMEVVLKQLLPEFTQQEEFIDLFLREAKLSATLDHANIVHTIDLVTAGNEYFIVMEYLPGGDLRTLIKRAKRRGRRFSAAAAIRITREVLSALAYAHVKRDFDGQPLKLIHRDVSPSNILVSYAGEVKLTDFGIAKAATHNSLFYKVKGKIGYMSPEQAKSEALDHRSDLYSLAVCLYEILTGERLFVHAGITTSAEEIYSQPVPQLSRKVPGLTPELDAIMAKALAISPDARYQTAGELQEALNRCAHRNGLLMSAPELAQELLEACGEQDQWRGDDDDEDLGYVKRAGTEVYDAADDEDEDEDDDLGLGPVSIHSIAAKSNDRLSRPKTEVGKFAGVELTSIINMIDLEANDGAKPLVDLNVGPRLDSGPRLMDSGQAALPRLPGGGVLGRPDPRQPPSMDPGALDMMPTAPRAAPALPPAPAPAPYPGGSGSGRGPVGPGGPVTLAGPPMKPRSQAQQRVGPPSAQQRARTRAGSAPRKRSKLRPWMVIAAILLLAGVSAIIVAMSGPDVSVKQGK